jgi:hypothetical protein
MKEALLAPRRISHGMCAGQSARPLRAYSCRPLPFQRPYSSESVPRLHTTCCSTDRFIVSSLLKRSRSPIALVRCSTSDKSLYHSSTPKRRMKGAHLRYRLLTTSIAAAGLECLTRIKNEEPPHRLTKVTGVELRNMRRMQDVSFAVHTPAPLCNLALPCAGSRPGSPRSCCRPHA